MSDRLVSGRVIVDHPRVGKGGLNSLHLHGDCNVGVDHIVHDKMRLLTAPKLVLRLNSQLAMIKRTGTVRGIRGMLNGTIGALGSPGLTTVFVNVMLKLVLNSVPVTVPNVDAPIGLNLTNKPVMMKVLVKYFNPHFRLVACAAQDTGLVLHNVKLSLCLTYLKLSTNTRFFRAIVHPRKTV